jgi:hypothetical protein
MQYSIWTEQVLRESGYMQFRTVAVTFFALWALALVSSTPAYAQNGTAGLTTSVAAPKPAEPKPFSITAGIGRSRNLYDFQDGTLQEATDFQLIPTYKWSLGATSLVLGYSHDERYNENSDISDIVIAQSFKGWDFKRFVLKPGLSLTLPQSKVSRELKNLEFAIGGKLAASIKPEFLVKGFSFSASLGLNRSIHRYETALNGAMNNQYASKQGIVTGYAIGAFSFDLEISHINAWTYKGGMRESYEHNESASVGFADYYSFTVGHTNGGSVFKANGYESNYRLIDENNSMVYAQLGMQY